MASAAAAADRSVLALRLRARGGASIAPMLVLILIFFMVPLLYLFRISFTDQEAAVATAFGVFSLSNYAEIFGDAFFFEMIFNSLRVGFCTVSATLLIGYPVAYYLTRISGWERTLISAACLLPLFVNIIVGVLGWYILLLPFGFFQGVLQALGLLDGPLPALRSFWALVAVLVYEHLPFAILILTASLQNVPADKIHAAQILGAPLHRIFLTIVLPLTMPGIVATVILVFSLSISSYLVPILITGQRVMVLPIAIFSYTSELLDWPLASAVALVLLVIVAALTYGFTILANRLTRRGEWEIV